MCLYHVNYQTTDMRLQIPISWAGAYLYFKEEATEAALANREIQNTSDEKFGYI